MPFFQTETEKAFRKMNLEAGLGSPGRARTGLVYVKFTVAAKPPVPVPQAEGLWRNWVNLLLVQ